MRFCGLLLLIPLKCRDSCLRFGRAKLFISRLLIAVVRFPS